MSEPITAPELEELPVANAIDCAARVAMMVSERVNELKTLEETVNASMARAKKAQSDATSAKEKSAGWFKKKEAIEALQESGYTLSEAVTASADAHKLSFEFQTRLAEIANWLFFLGMASIAHNRMVVRELELRLKGASSEQLSDLARNELMHVVEQLKAQEDLESKHQRLRDKVKSHQAQIIEHAKKDKQQDGLIAENGQSIRHHDTLIQQQAEKDVEHDELISGQAKVDERHDALIQQQAETDVAHDKLISEQAKLDQMHDEALKALACRCEKLEATVEKLRRNIVEGRRPLDKNVVLSLAIGIAALTGVGALLIMQFVR